MGDHAHCTGWPFPGDNALRRARAVASAYRQHLLDVDPELCALVDRRMLAFGQAWVVPAERLFDDDVAITTAEAALIASVSQDTIRQWACMPHPNNPGMPLLPRQRRRGRQMTYLVVHVKAAAAIMEHSRRRNTRLAA